MKIKFKGCSVDEMAEQLKTLLDLHNVEMGITTVYMMGKDKETGKLIKIVDAEGNDIDLEFSGQTVTTTSASTTKDKKDISRYEYLSGLSQEVRDWVIEVVNSQNLNLYHSATSVLTNHAKRQGSFSVIDVEQITEAYIDKYILERKYLIGKEDAIREIFNYAYKRLCKKYN